jgi:thymidylate synthase (FAD)
MVEQKEIGVHKHGFVRLVDSMPQKDLDDAIVQAARVSYAGGTTATRSGRGLIRYLMRHYHNTPFEMVEFKFHIKMPIFIARQHLRHRTASVNELSARYSVVPDEYFVPPEYRKQSLINKQGSEGSVELDEQLSKQPQEICQGAFMVYQNLLDEGCCRELARSHLPQSTYTEFYWKINLHNLMHYLHLRMESGAQQEIQDYANAIYKLVKDKVPHTMEAFMDFRVNSVSFTGPEIEALKNLNQHLNLNPASKYLNSPGEEREFKGKLEKLGILSLCEDECKE